MATSKPEKALKNEVYIDANGFLHVTYHGYLDLAQGMEIYESMLKLSKTLITHKKHVLVLADTRDMRQHSPESRRSGFLIRDTIPFQKMAIIVSSTDPYTRKISEILSSAFVTKQIKYFRSESWAKKWLKSNP